MAPLLDIPFPLRLIAVMVVAAVVATWLNAAIYAFAWRKRSFSPWQAPPPGMPLRTWLDRVPIVGWWRLRREQHEGAPAHWVRPLAIEILFPLFIGWLYWWETAQFGLVAQQGIVLGMRFADYQSLAGPAHLTFLLHFLLLAFALVASVIDLDDFYIPDIVTVPGTLLALVLAALLPLGLLPQIEPAAAPLVPGIPLGDARGNPLVDPFFGSSLYYHPVHAGSLGPHPGELAPRPNVTSLVVALGCYWLWCFAFVRRRWLRRRGWWRAVRHFGRRVASDATSSPLREVAIAGTLAILAVWWWGAASWVGLTTSLIGLAAGGGAIWLIRILASAAMGEEAMGFGDVILMMMIGAYVGWQATIVIFFAGAMFALLLAVVRLLLHRQRHIPYGPFLSLGTLAVILGWDGLWLRFGPLFDIPWLIPGVMVVGLVLCGVMLWILQGIKRLVGIGR